jgi:DNA gyrase/topoisomerase IV subunit A
MATNIPPHNLGEVIAACKAYIEDPLISIEQLMEYVPGPDFPTAPLILGQAGIRAAYQTGRGSIIMRARHKVEEGRGDRRSIVLTSIPTRPARTAWSRRWPRPPRTSASRASATSATNRTAKACASSST